MPTITHDVVLDPAGFAPFLDEVTRGDRMPGQGHEPFLWQLDLVAQLINGDVPDRIDVPTGFGKTSVVLAWAYALAATANSPDPLPRRLFFVVDRRLVVDAAHETATKLRDTLDAATPSERPVAAAVADRLHCLHGDPTLQALTPVRMRGGTTWEARWLARPDQAALVVGTVDQFGSRLLFRGYGTSPRMRPIDAALTGTDAWLVIDEAHIAEPLVRTVDRVREIQAEWPDAVPEDAGSGERLASASLRRTLMSATGSGGGNVLQADLKTEAAADPTRVRAVTAARRRIGASKPSALVEITNLKSSSPRTRRRTAQRLGQTLGILAQGSDPDARIIAVITNTIAAARAAHDHLINQGEDALLLMGRSRQFERDQLLDERAFARARVGASRSLDEARLYIVATQTIEVGADLDFDLLVTETAPLPSLVQRFGRVNRLGERSDHMSAIVHAAGLHGPGNDPVYGDATTETWSYLTHQASAPALETTAKASSFSWPERDSAHLTFGLRNVRRLVEASPPAALPAPEFVPCLLAAHVERLASTSPSPEPDQDIAPFLHGVTHRTPDVSVAWRAVPSDLMTADAELTAGTAEARLADEWSQWIDLSRPTSYEFVDVPIWELRALLAAKPSTEPTSDLDTTPTDDVDEPSSDDSGGLVLGIAYRGPGEPPRLVRGPHDVMPGQRIILAATVGGHDRFGWTGLRIDQGVEAPVPDVADLAPGRRQGQWRMSPTILRTLAEDGEQEAVMATARDVLRTWEADGKAAGVDDDCVVQGIAARLIPGAQEQMQRFVTGRRMTSDVMDGDRRIVLLAGSAEPADRDDTVLSQVSDDDVASTSSGLTRQTLDEHGREVQGLAAELAERLGLPPSLVQAVGTAGRWHDLGKADERFQLMLHDADPLAAKVSAEPLAKSGRDPRDPLARRAARMAGIPRGFRHEAVSARIADELAVAAPQLVADADVELVRHLVVAHHGHARPLLPPLLDPEAPAVRVTAEEVEIKVDGARHQVDWGQPEQFERLNARYGPWGLALLETVVRLADIRCSEVAS